jgi:hypothetical protein
MLSILIILIQSNIQLSVTTLHLPSYRSKIDKAPSYLISGDRSDIQWKIPSSDQQMIKLTPKTENGFSSVLVQVFYEGTSSFLSTISASATKEKDEIVNIFVSAVHSIQIISKTTSLFVQENKEAFEVQGFDVNGNAFHSVDGLSFTYSYDSKIIKRIDNPKTSTLILEGIKEGTTKLTFSLSPSISSNTITLSIFEPIVLRPSNVTVKVGDSYEFKVFSGSGKSLREINLPNNYFSFSSFNKEIVQVNNDGKLIGHKAGEGIIQVFDRRSGYYQAFANVIVV